MTELETARRELGRWRKKAEDQQKRIREMEHELALARAGSRELSALVDAVLIAVTVRFGERATDPDQPEQELGWRLELPEFNAAALHEKYELRARKDDLARAYILGVMEREK